MLIRWGIGQSYICSLSNLYENNVSEFFHNASRDTWPNHQQNRRKSQIYPVLRVWGRGFLVFEFSAIVFFREEFSAIVDEPPTDFFSFQLYIYIQANTGDLHLGLKDVIDACSSFFSRTCHATLFH